MRVHWSSALLLFNPSVHDSVQVAVDFVSPEGAAQCMKMAEQMRKCPHTPGGESDDDPYQDKLQVRSSGPDL